ncbi:MAG: ABC transporter permease [bacterium]
MRYLRLWAFFFRNCLIREMSFRGNFLLQVFGNLLWFIVNIAFFRVIYLHTPTIGGWKLHQTLLLVSTAQIVNYLYGGLALGIHNMNDYVKRGTLDFILLKPADTQFLISTRFVNWRSLSSIVFPLSLILYLILSLKIKISPLSFILYLLLLLCGFLLQYSLGFIVMTTAIWLVNAEALYALFSQIVDLARYPLSIYKGGVRIFFTFVIPIILIANVPALTLLGELSHHFIAIVFFASVFFFLLSRRFFAYALSFYCSASS